MARCSSSTSRTKQSPRERIQSYRVEAGQKSTRNEFTLTRVDSGAAAPQPSRRSVDVSIDSALENVLTELSGILRDVADERPDSFAPELEDFQLLLSSLPSDLLFVAVELIGPQVFNDWSVPRDFAEIYVRALAEIDPVKALEMVVILAGDDESMPGIDEAVRGAVRRAKSGEVERIASAAPAAVAAVLRDALIRHREELTSVSFRHDTPSI